MCISVSFIRLDFIYDLFEKVGSRNNEEKMGTARRKPTVSSQFRVSDTSGMCTVAHTLHVDLFGPSSGFGNHHMFGFSLKND